MNRNQQVAVIAERFATVLRSWLTPSEYEQMKVKNVSYGPGICASHDYCDANMAMMEAFESVTGSTLLPEDDSGMSEADCALWNDAWDLARKLYLTS